MQFLVDAASKVKQSGRHNFQVCRILLPSKFNFEFLETELHNYNDKMILEFLKFGFPVDCTPTNSDPGIPSNHSGASDFPDEINYLLDKETKLGGFLGPFSEPPFSDPRYSPLNSVPKKDSHERRLILDLSFPAGHSINDGISKDWYLGQFDKLKLPSLDNLVARIMQSSSRCKLFKVDLARGYKQMYICPLDFEKMGFTFQGKYYFDCTLSMGSRSSARCCQWVTNAVVYIFTNWGYFAINYLDDLGGAQDEESADLAFNTLRRLLLQFGLTEAINKSCPPNYVMVFLGIEVNSILLTLKIPGDKMQEILNILELWHNKQFCTIKEVQSLAGLLNFASRCVRSGRVYLSRILNFLREMPNTGTHRIPRETQMDLQWWKEFFPLYNGVTMMMNNQWDDPDETLASDSCLSGGGAYIGWQFLHFEFPKSVLKICKHINQLECVTLVVAIAKWAHFFTRRRIQVYCDNQVTVASINSGTSRNRVLQSCLRYLHRIMAVESFDVRAVFLTSSQNRAADSLSRWHLHERHGAEFSNMMDGRKMEEVNVSPTDFQFLF